MDYNQKALELHKKHKGKITTALRDQNELDSHALSAYYTPGVAEVSRIIAANPELLPEYTWTNNLVGVVSDGSAVLGLGDIGPKGSMPVMEGKALLFKHFAGIDAVPITLDVHSADEIVNAVKAIAPSFGAINLEDIAAPKCFEVEERLKQELDIPVFHDDQHGTAVVVLAGIINSLKLTGRQLSDNRIVIAGAGAAGVAIAKLLHTYSKQADQAIEIVLTDRQGIISKGRTDLSKTKQQLLEFTNPHNLTGTLADAATSAGIFIGVSGPDTLHAEHVALMAQEPIIFALSNPTPEIMPDTAIAAGAAVVATGRSDLPNQVNNALAFPGIFYGALKNSVAQITDTHKIAAAQALAALIDEPRADSIIPSVFDERIVPAIADVIV